MRKEKIRKGIIDSSDDEKVENAKETRDEEVNDDDGTGSSSSEDGVANFIVEDDGDIDPDEIDRVQRMMPSKRMLDIVSWSLIVTLFLSQLNFQDMVLYHWKTISGSS